MCLSTKQKGPSWMQHKRKSRNMLKIEMQALVAEKEFLRGLERCLSKFSDTSTAHEK